MYKIYADDTLIYDGTVEDYKIGKGNITLEINKSGSFVFSLYPDHFYYDKLVKLKTVITVYRFDKIIFRGRILNDVTDYWNNKVITCEGELGFLQDSIIRPYEFTGSPLDLLIRLVAEHNAQVDEFKRFKLGTVDIDESVDDNDYINRSNSAYETTFSNLNGRFLESDLGGYFYITHGEDGKETIPTLNYVTNLNKAASQTIEFGVNLKNYTKTAKAEEIATAIIPLGAEIETESESDENIRVKIDSVNNGVDYVYSESGVALYGWIFKVIEWDDVTVPSELKRKAEKKLDTIINQNININLTAIDLHLLDPTVESINIYEFVNAISTPHNFNASLLCNKQSYDLLKPDNDSYELGYSKSSFTDANSKIIQGTVEKVTNKFVTTDKFVTKIEETKSIIETTKDSILTNVSTYYVTESKLNTEVGILDSRITQTVNAINAEIANTYATQNFVSQEVAKVAVSEDQIAAVVSKNLTDYSTTAQMESKIKLAVDGIDLSAYAKNTALGETNKALADLKLSVDDNTADIKLVVTDGKADGSLLIGAINGESTAKISADRLDIDGKTLNIKVNSTNIVGTLTIGQLPSTVAETSDIPTKVSELSNDSSYATTGQLPTKVSQLTNDSSYATTSAVSTAQSNATTNAVNQVKTLGYQTESGVTTIIGGTVTADFIKALKLEVGDEIAMGANAKISWANVDSKPDVATKSEVSTAQTNATNAAVSQVEQKGYATTTQVSTAKSEAISAAATDATSKANAAQTAAINAASSDATSKANSAKAAAVTEVKELGYQTATDVTTITKNTVTTAYVNALNVTAASASIASKLTVSDVFEANASTNVVKIGGWRADGNSIANGGTFGTDGYAILCSTGSITSASIGGSPDQSGWVIAVGSHFGVDIYGNVYADNGHFKGEINASTGNIGGLTISSQAISSGYDGLTFTRDGLVIVQNLDVRNDFIADTLKIGHIGGRNDGSAAIHFEETTPITQELNLTYDVTWDFANYLDVTLSEVSIVAFPITFEYADNSNKLHSETFIVPKGVSSVSFKLEASYNWTYTSPPSTVFLESGETLPAIGCEGDFSPYGGERSLGSRDSKWNEIWANNGTIQTSDRKEKNTISPLAEKYGKVFDKLVPVTYKFNVNTSDRLHLGLIAQDVKQALDEVGIDSKDFAAYCEWENKDGSIGCGMRYTELIPLNIYEIQKLKARIKELEERISSL